MAWNKNEPQNATKIRNYPTVISNNWTAIEENDTGVVSTSLNQWAVHLIDRSTIGGANTPTRLDNVGQIYCRDDGTANELFFLDSENPANEVQLTRSSAVNAAASGTTCLPGGLLLKWAKATNVTTSPNVTITFDTPFTSSVYSVTFGSAKNTGFSGNPIPNIVSVSTSSVVVNSSANGVLSTIYIMAIGV